MLCLNQWFKAYFFTEAVEEMTMNLFFAGVMPDDNTEQEITVMCDFYPLEQQTKSKTISVSHGNTNPSILSVPK